MKSQKERRKHKRANLLMPTVFETDQKEVKLKKIDLPPAVIKNISSGGALVKTSVFIPKGATLSLRINLPRTSSALTVPIVDKKGVVQTNSKLVSFRRQVGKKYEMGVEFVKLDSWDKKIISNIVNKETKKEINKKPKKALKKK